MEAFMMMEDILGKSRLFFDDYTKKLIKAKDVHVAEALTFKRDHSQKVAELSAFIAGKLQLEEENSNLAFMMGLLHDLGRFVQFEKYQTFDDQKGEDHAAITVDLIQDADFFMELPPLEQQLVREVVMSHNKPVITAKDARAIQFSKILRDADKLDNLETAVSLMKKDGSFSMPFFSLNLPKAPGVGEAVIRSIAAEKTALKSDLRCINDFKLYLMSLVYDINFRVSFHYVNQKQLIPKIYDTLPKRDDVINAYRQIRLFIENKFVNSK